MKYFFSYAMGILLLSTLSFASISTYAQNDRYDTILNQSIEKINTHLETAPATKWEWGAKTIKNFLINKIIKIVIPIFIVLGIFFAIMGWYKLIFSESAESTKIGIQYLVYWVLGIIIMMSARYITDVLTYKILSEWGKEFTVDPWLIAEQLYSQVAYPFLKVAFYIILGIMFILLVTTLLKYLFSTDDKIKKSAGTIITWNFIALFIIIGAKQIIEAVYGKQEQIIKTQGNINTLWDIWDAILSTKELPLVYTVINWIMSLTALVVLIIIIYQSYLLLTQPDNEDQFKRIKKSILYIFIGILVIGAGYLITNFLIIN